MNKDIWYVVADDIYHQDSMMFADPDWVMFSGTKEECEQFIVEYKIQQEQENGLAHQEQWDLHEEMQELDPRDYERLDDFGDPCS